MLNLLGILSAGFRVKDAGGKTHFSNNRLLVLKIVDDVLNKSKIWYPGQLPLCLTLDTELGILYTIYLLTLSQKGRLNSINSNMNNY
jgi:hypothetical protein